MAITKVRTALWSASILASGAASVLSAKIDLTGGYGAQLNMRITNANSVTTAGQFQTYVFNDSGGTLQTTFGGALVSSSIASAVTSWSIDLPIGVAAVALTVGSNVGANITVDADVSNVTAI